MATPLIMTVPDLVIIKITFLQCDSVATPWIMTVPDLVIKKAHSYNVTVWLSPDYDSTRSSNKKITLLQCDNVAMPLIVIVPDLVIEKSLRPFQI